MRLHMTLFSSAILLATQASAQLPTSNLWGVNSQHQIWHLDNAQWNQVQGPSGAVVTQASAASDGTVWALDQNANIYSYTGSGWQQMTGQFTQVSVGSAANIWGVHNGFIYQWNGSGFVLIPGEASQVSVGADGTVWALNQGNIWSYSGSGWSQVQGQLTQVSVGSATNVWGVNAAAPEWLWQWNGSQWAQIGAPSTFTPIQVSVGEDGTVYAVDQRSFIFHWLGGAWQTISGGLSQISVGLSDRFLYSSTAVTPQGSWSATTNANAAAGGYLESSNMGDSLSFTFTGDSIALYRLMDSNGGQATVSVDGNAMGVIDFFFPQQQTGTNTQRWQIPAVLDHLGAGQHKLTLTVSGNHDTASNTNTNLSAYNSNGNNVYIDCFIVQPHSLQAQISKPP